MSKRTDWGIAFGKHIVIALLGLFVTAGAFVMAKPAEVHAAVTVNASEMRGDDILFDSGMYYYANTLDLLQDVTIILDADISYDYLGLSNYSLTIQADPDHPGKKLSICGDDTSAGNIILESGILVVEDQHNGVIPGLSFDGDLTIHNGRCELGNSCIVRNFTVSGADAYVTGNHLLASSINISNGTLIVTSDYGAAIVTGNDNNSISITGGSVTAITTDSGASGIYAYGNNSSLSISGLDTVVNAQGPGGAIKARGALTVLSDLPNGVAVGQFTDSDGIYYGLVSHGNPVTQITIGIPISVGTGNTVTSSSSASGDSKSPLEEDDEYAKEVQAINALIENTLKQYDALTAAGKAADVKALRAKGITINTEILTCLMTDSYELIYKATQAGIPVTINFNYKGQKFTSTIPAYTKLNPTSLCDKDGFCGFCNIMKKYGGGLRK